MRLFTPTVLWKTKKQWRSAHLQAENEPKSSAAAAVAPDRRRVLCFCGAHWGGCGSFRTRRSRAWCGWSWLTAEPTHAAMVTFHSLLSLLVLVALHGEFSRAAECHGKVGSHNYEHQPRCTYQCLISALFVSHFVIFARVQPDPNAKPNLNPIQTDPPKFIKQVKNGKLYSVGSEEDLIYLVHVWGECMVILHVNRWSC